MDCAACGRLDAGSGAVCLSSPALLSEVAILVASFLAPSPPILPASTTSLTGWTSPGAWWAVALTLLVAAYGLHGSTGGRPFGDRPLLAEP